MTRERRAFGASGEAIVAAWYVERGYEVLDRNWRCREGELDLVLRRGTTVVFCEVKSRRSTAFGAPLQAVTPPKQRRIRSLALQWLSSSRVGAPLLRFDVAGVLDGEVEVVEAAF